MIPPEYFECKLSTMPTFSSVQLEQGECLLPTCSTDQLSFPSNPMIASCHHMGSAASSLATIQVLGTSIPASAQHWRCKMMVDCLSPFYCPGFGRLLKKSPEKQVIHSGVSESFTKDVWYRLLILHSVERMLHILGQSTYHILFNIVL